MQSGKRKAERVTSGELGGFAMDGFKNFDSIIFSRKAFGKQAVAGRFHSVGQSPLLPTAFARHAYAPSQLLQHYRQELPIPSKQEIIIYTRYI